MLNENQLLKELLACPDFESFFVKVNSLKTHMDVSELYQVNRILGRNDFGYSASTITYLRDCIMSEIVYMRSTKEIKHDETSVKEKIVENFQKVFPHFRFVKEEYTVENIGRIDIFAKDVESGRPVIIELKMGARSPNQQLFAYGREFKNPILVGVTQYPVKYKSPEIQYYTYSELGV